MSYAIIPCISQNNLWGPNLRVHWTKPVLNARESHKETHRDAEPENINIPLKILLALLHSFWLNREKEISPILEKMWSGSKTKQPSNSNSFNYKNKAVFIQIFICSIVTGAPTVTKASIIIPILWILNKNSEAKMSLKSSRGRRQQRSNSRIYSLLWIYCIILIQTQCIKKGLVYLYSLVNTTIRTLKS